MKVTFLACSVFSLDGMDYLEDHGFYRNVWVNEEPADLLAEFAGRSCYQSWNRPNPKTATNQGYLNNIIEKQHFSVLEHASVTFYIEGISRNLTHELIRHRHFSFSELSQRFCDMTDARVVVPPALREDEGRSDTSLSDVVSNEYNDVVEHLHHEGFTRKQCREAARFYLPSGMETKIVLTGNHRAFREFMSKRNSPHADAEIQLLAKELLRQLKEIAPHTYQDMEI